MQHRFFKIGNAKVLLFFNPAKIYSVNSKIKNPHELHSQYGLNIVILQKAIF
jgi:hypothetical protein